MIDVSKLRPNIDLKTVEGFGEEWSAYDQEGLDPEEYHRLFEAYFSTFPFADLPANSEGIDLGCGTGRWAMLVAPKVGTLHCIDPSSKALAVAKRRLAHIRNLTFHEAGVDEIPFPDGSQDFAFSLGVLHHIPNTAAAMKSCVRKLKPGAPFLTYIYYSFDNRPTWFRTLWRSTEGARWALSRLPFPLRKALTTLIAATVYWPLSRTARLLARSGCDVSTFPLSAYRENSFYTLRTDALDRFGTRLEQRFSKAEIEAMMRDADLIDIIARDEAPYWVLCGRKAGASTL